MKKKKSFFPLFGLQREEKKMYGFTFTPLCKFDIFSLKKFIFKLRIFLSHHNFFPNGFSSFSAYFLSKVQFGINTAVAVVPRGNLLSFVLTLIFNVKFKHD